MTDHVTMMDKAAPPAPRKVGRPRGTPKSGGTKRGTAKWSSDQVREKLLPDTCELLLAVVRGDPVLVGGERTNGEVQAGAGRWRRPDLKQRLHATQLILDRTVPQLKAAEIVASVDQQVSTDEPRHDVRQISRAILAVLSSAAVDGENSDFEAWGGGPAGRICKPTDGCSLSPRKNFREAL